jgi:hypothetical protein
MAQRVFASVDLVRLIYSFGDPSHRKFTHDLKWDLRPWPEVCTSRFVERKLNTIDHIYYTLKEFMEEYSTEKLKWMLSTYKRCYCCARHNTSKPMCHMNQVIIPEPFVFESHPEECDCSCRQLSRHCIDILNDRR